MSAASSQADIRIPLTVLTGFLGSGKTTLLNLMVRDPAYAEAAVVINEFGEIGVDHHLVRGAEGRMVLIEGGCICCTASGAVADALRDLFMAAVRRQIRPFRHVLVETTGLAGPAPLLFTLRHDAFLAERYVYRGAIAVADAQHLPRQLKAHPEAVQQIALADAVAISKADICAPDQVERAREAVSGINPGAAVAVLTPGAEPPDAFRLLNVPNALNARQEGQQPDVARQMAHWLGAFTRVSGAPHDGVSHFVLDMPRPIARPDFLAAMDALQARHGEALLRVKGVVRFAREAVPCAVHGVHRQLYPLEPMMPPPPSSSSPLLSPLPSPLAQSGSQDELPSRLVFILRGDQAQTLPSEAARALGQDDLDFGA